MDQQCDCGLCVECRKRARLATRAANDRKRREWMQRRWPDLDVELGRLGYVLACNGLFHQAPRSKGALIKAARAGAQ